MNEAHKKLLLNFVEYCRSYVPQQYCDGQDQNVAAGEEYLVLEFVLSWVDEFSIPLGDAEWQELENLTRAVNIPLPNELRRNEK